MKKAYFIGIVLFLIAIEGNSQNLKELLEKGDKLFARQDYSNALKSYLAAAEIDPNDSKTNFRVGMSYLHSDHKALAVNYLEKAYQKDPAVDADIDYHLGMAYQNAHQYRKAIDHFFEFKKKNRKLAEIADHKIQECTIGDSLARNPVLVEIKNLGENVNSRFHEYSPLISGNGNTLIFTSNRSDNEEVIRAGTNYEDIYVSRRTESGWGTAQKISDKINHKFNEAAASISHDGNTLFIYYEEGAGDIYTSTFTDGEWSEPKPLGKNINHPHYWETSACISADGNKLYFTSNRPGGEGELDIYVSELDSKGEWGKAVNLGPTINTPLHEDSPFIHADGVTLYFSSDGHPSMGSNDLFKTTFADGKWTTPTNLGFPINSIEYDGFLYVSEDKKSAYYSALREDGMGDADIYFVKFLDPPPPKPVEPVVVATPPPAEPKEEDYVDPLVQLHKDMKIVTVLKGKVIDESTAAPLGAVITLVDNETRKIIARINSSAETGDFELVIPHGGNYGVATDKAGYLFNSINFNLPQFAEYQEIDTHILMVKAEVGSKVVLKNIFFDVGKSDLKQESIAELEKIKQLLLSNAQLKVQINGHTDNSGNAATNQVLSLKRAEAVVQYLIEHGIDTVRLSAKGFGSERPLVSNDDEAEGREINRRTEIEITEVGGSG